VGRQKLAAKPPLLVIRRGKHQPPYRSNRKFFPLNSRASWRFMPQTPDLGTLPAIAGG
jgi:hypothetical protein